MSFHEWVAAGKSFPRAREYFRLLMVIENSPGVFPACAGVFPDHPMAKAVPSSLSRVRGSISREEVGAFVGAESFPRAREYFHHCRRHTPAVKVFPACAGVFPINIKTGCKLEGLSRVRGSISYFTGDPSQQIRSFPRAREYFQYAGGSYLRYPVFPACAGVFP